MNAALKKRLEALEARVEAQIDDKDNTCFGIVAPDKQILRVIQYSGSWQEVDQEPDLLIPSKLEPILTRPKRFNIIIGGRGSGKSQNVAAIEDARIKDHGIKLCCFREHQNSIDDSVYSLLESQARKHEMEGFNFIQGHIRHKNGGQAKFRGLARNPDSLKSMDNFQDFWVEEAQASSEVSLKLLTPTMRAKDGRIIFTANPGSSEDPFSQRFINPFKDQLLKDGIFEDDLHLVIMMNWRDNPWFPDELKSEMEWDRENLPRALYDHIWEGEFNDSVEDALIMAEWFDACIDAHKKLGFEPTGAKIAAHDPSDVGPDSKGYAMRHGSVVLDVQEMTTGTVNEGGHWASGLAIQQQVDHFTWDGDGMGIALAEQMDRAFSGKKIDIAVFRGSEGVDRPEAMYSPSTRSEISHQKRNKDTFRNKRAQYYFELRDRIYRTYQAVVHNVYADPEKLVSFSSNIVDLGKLRSELCRLPVKPNGNGLFELYTKEQMKSKFKLASPNLGDTVMMLMRYNGTNNVQVQMPQALKPMGSVGHARSRRY